MRPSSQRRTVLGSTSRRAATSSSLGRARKSARRKVSFKAWCLQSARTPPTLTEEVPSRPSARYRSSVVPASLVLAMKATAVQLTVRYIWNGWDGVEHDHQARGNRAEPTRNPCRGDAGREQQGVHAG